LQANRAARTNILVYGMTQDGLRTDTIMLVSYYWQQKKDRDAQYPAWTYTITTVTRMPKWVKFTPTPRPRQPHNPNYPDQVVANVISKEYNQPIDYWVQFDMQGEVDFVNAIGGIDVNNPNAFTDCQYPTWDYSGYVRPCPHFDSGTQHLTGSRALTFSRSRHAFAKRRGLRLCQIQAPNARYPVHPHQAQEHGRSRQHWPGVTLPQHSRRQPHHQHVHRRPWWPLPTPLKAINPGSDLVARLVGHWQTASCVTPTLPPARTSFATACRVTAPVAAGGYKDSNYRQMAIYYVGHLITAAPMAPTDFVQAAGVALGYATPTPSPAGSH